MAQSEPAEPADVNDVAAYILEKQGHMSVMKLHKLLYYCQAWHLVWDAEKLFDSRIEAWRDGPVAPAIYIQHRGEFMLREWQGNSRKLEDHQAASVDAVLKVYGDMPAWKLRQRTHAEGPWLDARGDLPPSERSEAEIDTEAMYQYYLSRVSRA